MARLRAAVLCVGHQLHRPPGHRHSEADAPAAIRVDRTGLWRHRVLVPAGLRDRLHLRWQADGSSRHAGGIFNCYRPLERCGDGARGRHVVWPRRRSAAGRVRAQLQRLCCRVHDRAFRTGSGRGREFSRCRQDGRRMVPTEGARVRHWDLQRRYQHRRAVDAADRSDHYDQLWLGVGLHRHWCARVRLAGGVVAVVPLAGGAQAGNRWRAGVHPQRSAGAD